MAQFGINTKETDKAQNHHTERVWRTRFPISVFLKRGILGMISFMTAKSDLETPLPPDDNNLFLVLLARAQCPAESATVITPQNECSWGRVGNLQSGALSQ